MPLTKMSSLIFRVRFFQGLRNGNLSKILLPCFNRRKYGVTQSTRGHPMEKTVPGWCTQRRWRVTGRQDHALTSQSFKVGGLIKITARIGTTLDHFNRGFCPAQVIHVNQNEIGRLLRIQGKRNNQSQCQHFESLHAAGTQIKKVHNKLRYEAHAFFYLLGLLLAPSDVSSASRSPRTY